MVSSIQSGFHSIYRSASNQMWTFYQKSVIWINGSGNNSKLPRRALPKPQSSSGIGHAKAFYHRCVAWIKKNGSWVYSKLPPVQAFAVRHNLPLSNLKTSLINRKKWLIGGGTMIAFALFIRNYLRSMPQYPLVKMESTLDVAKLSVTIPKGKPLPINVGLVFCIDTSASMEGERRKAVVKALNGLLDNAQKKINESVGANIEIAIIGFNIAATEIISATKLVPSKGPEKIPSISKIKEKIQTIKCDGGTQILNGLERATNELKKIAKRTESQHLILLTDGDEKIDDRRRLEIHRQLTLVNANLFAIGIGKEHNKATLQKIAISENFHGTYIDTTSGVDTIESSISQIYTQAIASFQELELTIYQLKPGTWLVKDTQSAIKNEQLKYSLGSLSEGQSITKTIRIQSEKLKEPLNLSTLTFKLSFKDPRNRRGQIFLPWNPNTTIDPKILAD